MVPDAADPVITEISRAIRFYDWYDSTIQLLPSVMEVYSNVLTVLKVTTDNQKKNAHHIRVADS